MELTGTPECQGDQRSVPLTEVADGATAHCYGWNRRVCLYMVFVRSTQAAIATKDFLDIYLYDISRSNILVGKIESTRGLAMLLLLAPFGLMTDRFDRRRLLQVVSLFKIIPTILCIIGITTDSIPLLWPSLVLFSMSNQVSNQVLDVLYVDNIPDLETRTRGLSRKEMLTWLGTSMGPLLAILITFLHSGSGWSLPLVRNVVRIGLVCTLIVEPAVLLLVNVSNSSQHHSPHLGARGSNSGHDGVPSWTQEKVCGVRKRWLIPVWTDLVWAGTQLGGSMSLTYVSLFFRKDFRMGPNSLMCLRFCESMLLAQANHMTPRIVDCVGRGWACIVFILGGSVLMACVAGARVVWLAAPLFVLRTAVARANVPCTQSIIYECVAKQHRGRWSAVTSFKSASNGVGSFVGGHLADHTGDYRVGFLLTAIIHGVSGLLLIPVARMLPS